MTAHSPTPWVEDQGRHPDGIHIWSRGKTIAVVTDRQSAAFIVEACNAHDKLLADNKALRGACEELLADVPYAEPDPNGGCECGEYTDYVPLADEAPTCRHTRARAVLANSQEPQQDRGQALLGCAEVPEPRLTDAGTLAPADGLAASHCGANAASHEVSQRPAFSPQQFAGNSAGDKASAPDCLHVMPGAEAPLSNNRG